jgi:hypothetical protein
VAQLTEAAADQLDPTQAADLARVVELQAAWESPPDAVPAALAVLRHRQQGYDAFRAALAAYTARYRAAEVPEQTLNSPDRLGTWCRAVRAVFRRAGSVVPVHVLGKARRLADRVADRLKVERVGRGPGETVAAGIGELAAVIDWCEGHSGPVVPAVERRAGGWPSSRT